MQTAVETLVQFLPLLMFSALAFWRDHVVLYMLTAALSLFTAFNWYDAYTTTHGMAVALCLVVYTFLCFGLGLSILVKGMRQE